jgi:DNA invertase Pin-like site-specific DNA recombinase
MSNLTIRFDVQNQIISRKIRWGFKQKQKEGIVIVAPFGYKKDKNTNTIEIIKECAEIVRLIFNLYIDGMGIRKIAAYLNEQGYKSPAYYQKLHYGKSVP